MTTSAARHQPAPVLKGTANDAADRDPAKDIPGMPPNFGDWLLPHVVTFQGIVSSIARVYRPSDEALKASWDNARFMLNDIGVMECVEQRQRSLALLNWHVEAADEKTNREHKRLAENLTKILKSTPRFMQYRECLGKAVWYGKYGVQKRYRWKRLYGVDPAGIGGNLVIAEWKPVNGDKLVFRYDDGRREFDPNQVGIRVGAAYAAGTTVAGKWEEQAKRKVEPTDWGLAYFLSKDERELLSIHKHMIEDGEYEDPQSAGKIHGVGVRSRVFWEWYISKEVIAWLLEYLERSALGLEIWYYPWGNPEAEAATRKAAQERIGQGRNMILMPRPVDETGGSPFGVEKLEPGMAGVDALKTLLTEYFGHRIKRYILGQTLTSEAGSTGLGSNLATIHLDTYMQIIKYDATNLEETITNEDLEILKRKNYPHLADVPVYFKIDTEAADVDAKLGAYQKAWEMGAKIKASAVYDCIGTGAPTEEDDVLQNPTIQQQERLWEQHQQQVAAGMVDPNAPLPDPNDPNAAMQQAGGMPLMPEQGGGPISPDDQPMAVPAENGDRQKMQAYAKDAAGREHAPAGSPEGGQFTGGSSGKRPLPHHEYLNPETSPDMPEMWEEMQQAATPREATKVKRKWEQAADEKRAKISYGAIKLLHEAHVEHLKAQNTGSLSAEDARIRRISGTSDSTGRRTGRKSYAKAGDLLRAAGTDPEQFERTVLLASLL